MRVENQTHLGFVQYYTHLYLTPLISHAIIGATSRVLSSENNSHLPPRGSRPPFAMLLLAALCGFFTIPLNRRTVDLAVKFCYRIFHRNLTEYPGLSV